MNKKIDNCDLCGGKLSPGNTSLEIWRGEKLLVLRDIPADVCQQCDEAYVSAQISEKIDQFLEDYHQHRPKRYIPVPEFMAAQTIGA